MFKFLSKRNLVLKGGQNRLSRNYAGMLEAAGLTPVLADVGSAGASHAIWQPIASQSTVIGFDPDSRNTDKSFGKGYGRSIMIDRAVTPDDAAESVDFVLTEYPSCSSMLNPDLEALSSFSFRDFFRPVSRRNVPATSLNRVIQEQKLEAIHWLKLDSQGADLRLLQSLDDSYFNRMLAVDIEPGLIRAYESEDLFTDCHAWLIDHGFWMSRLEYQSYPKLRPEILTNLAENTGIDQKQLMRRLPKAPTAIEGRYLREIAWLDSESRKPESLIMSAVFGLLDGQPGYACDVVALYEERFGRDMNVSRIREVAIDAIG